MEKINAVLVLLSGGALEAALKKLNLDNVNLAMIVTEGDPDEKTLQVGERAVPRGAFSNLYNVAGKYKNFIWLLSGGNEPNALAKMKNFLVTLGISEENIISLEALAQINATWLANLRHVEKRGADFFATGNEFMQSGLNLNLIPSMSGVNLADANQDLRQGYLIAQHIFKTVKRGKIKFVLIGLMPYSFRYDNYKDFANQKNLQYMFALNDSEENPRAELWQNLLSDDVKNIFETPAAQADLNFDALKENLGHEFSTEAIADWKEVVRFFINTNPESNFQILKDYIELCLANGAKPIGVVQPFFAATKGAYSKKLLREFRTMIAQLAADYDFACVDMFDLSSWTFNCFSDMTHLNSKGTQLATAFLSLKLLDKNLIPVENFCDMNYEYLDSLSAIVPKNDHNAFLEKVFSASAQMIARKDKIKVGFVLRTAAEWSGDDLYNLFANDERFETTIFLCLAVTQPDDELAKGAFLRGVEQFKSHGLNVVPMDTWKARMPAQDVLIFLTPYFTDLTRAFRLKRLTAKTLITHITYSFFMSVRGKTFYNKAIFNIAWKVFFASAIVLKMFKSKSNLGMPRGLFSGYPRIDTFFKNSSDFKFDWKMARPDAKKIIYAPHWSINAGVRFSTFQWNYKFMYEFAKAHPEISWVVKPHPALSAQVVSEKIFPSIEAYKEYMQAWDALPNAQVYTGAYYQDIFATSDGMIQDCSSFIAEYQYVDKPMIYLTRDTQIFNELGKSILKVSYTVDGKDLDAIAALMQRVFIDGDDFKAAERKDVFDKYLNYPKANGMLASEFIYKSIADALKA